MNFNAISKNVKNLQTGLIEPKLWKICQYESIPRFLRNWDINSAFFTELGHQFRVFYGIDQFRIFYGIDQFRIFYGIGPSTDNGIQRFFHNFASSGPILIIFTFLKIALKFVGSFSLLEECGNKNKGATSDKKNWGTGNFLMVILLVSFPLLYGNVYFLSNFLLSTKDKSHF